MKIRSVLPTTKLHGIEFQVGLWDRSTKKPCCIFVVHLSGLTPEKKPNYPLKVREIVAKQGNICFFEIAFGNNISHHRSPIRNYHRKAISLPQFVPWIFAVQRSTKSNGLKVKIFGSTSISGYTDRVDEICAWLEAWKTDIWEGRGPVVVHRGTCPMIHVFVFGAWDDLPSQQKLPMSTPHIIIPKKTESYRTSTCLSIWSTCLSFFLAFL